MRQIQELQVEMKCNFNCAPNRYLSVFWRSTHICILTQKYVYDLTIQELENIFKKKYHHFPPKLRVLVEKKKFTESGFYRPTSIFQSK